MALIKKKDRKTNKIGKTISSPKEASPELTAKIAAAGLSNIPGQGTTPNPENMLSPADRGQSVPEANLKNRIDPNKPYSYLNANPDDIRQDIFNEKTGVWESAFTDAERKASIAVMEGQKQEEIKSYIKKYIGNKEGYTEGDEEKFYEEASQQQQQLQPEYIKRGASLPTPKEFKEMSYEQQQVVRNQGILETAKPVIKTFASVVDWIRSGISGKEPKRILNAKETLHNSIETSELMVDNLGMGVGSYSKTIAQIDEGLTQLEYLENEASVMNDGYLDTYLDGGLALEAYIKNNRVYLETLKEKAKSNYESATMARYGF
jgi:hypothetical protein